MANAEYMKEYNQRASTKARQRARVELFSPEQKRQRLLTMKQAHALRRYGLTLESRDVLLEAQDGRCALAHCRQEIAFGKRGFGRVAHIDHDHKTGRVRGILCGKCNTALGSLGDSVESIEQVLNYVREKT